MYEREEIKAMIREHTSAIGAILGMAREQMSAQSIELVTRIKAGGRYSESQTQIKYVPEDDLVRRLTDEVTADHED